MKTVLVMLASFNGASFISEQILSILNQKNVLVDVLVSDDSSVDGTIEQILLLNDKRIKIVSGKFGTPNNNFYNLINISPDTYDYYAFSDQDDVWDDDKLDSAIQLMDNGLNVRKMTYGITRICDSDLKYKGKNTKVHSTTTFSQSIISSRVQGSTIVMNRELLVFLKGKTSKTEMMYDAWIHKTCLATGGLVFFDSTPRSNYRIHSSNAFTKNNNKRFKLLRRIFSKKYAGLRSSVAAEWKILFKDYLTDDANHFIELVSNQKSFKNRFAILFTKKYTSPYLLEKMNFNYLCLRGLL